MAAVKVDMSSVLEFIKNSKEPVNKAQILEATGYSGDFKYCIKTLKARHEELETVGNKFTAAYIWKPAKPLYSEMKNPEGYKDSTAGKAIANVMRSSGNGRYPMRQHFGEVWSNSSVRDNAEGLLVISANGGVCIGYNVYPEFKAFIKKDFCFKWNDKKGWHYISLINPINVYENYIGKCIMSVPEELMDTLRTEVAKIFPISVEIEEKIVEVEKVVEKEVPVEKIVEKIVEKEVPVEVEKIVEKPTDPREIELAVLKAQNEIYELLIFGKTNLNLSKKEVI